MLKNKRLIAIITSLLMVISVLPGTALAGTFAGTHAGKPALAAAKSTLAEYPGKQGGSTNIRVYMFHGGQLETSGDNVYANVYNRNYTIKTDMAVTDYWSNYILEELDSTKPIDFAFFVSGSQTAGTNATHYPRNLIPYLSIRDREGNVVLTGEAIYKSAKDAGFGGTGGGSGGGPARGFDVEVSVGSGTLKPHQQYAFVLSEGISGKATSTKLNKKILFNFTTAPIKVSTIQLSNAKAALKQNQTMTLSAAAAPDNATDKAVTWFSSNTEVAAVDQEGRVTARSGGDATITATAKDGSGAKASCEIRVIGTTAAKAAAATYNSIKISWKKVAKADGYTLYRYSRKAKKYKAIKTTKALSYTDKKLTAGQKQSYKVKAYRIIDQKKVFGSDSAKATAAAKPVAPKLKVIAGKGKAVIKWNAVPGITKYQLYKSSKKSGKFYKERVTVKTRYTDYGLKKGKACYYKIKAYKVVKGKKVYSGYSKVVKVKAR